MTHTAKRQKILFFASLTLIYIVAWIVNIHLLINWDVSWDMRITQRLLAGGNYIQSFIDNNPPLILFLYIPPVALANYFPISIMTALYAYVFFLASVSLLLCGGFINKIFALQRGAGYALLCFIAIFFLLIPIVDFGEREHLMLIFTLPYFLAVSYRMQGKTINPYYAVLIGLIAAAGFAIKPYFLAAFALVEIYFVYYTHKVSAWMRIEVYTVLLFLLLYLLTILVFYPAYVTTVVPMVQSFYYGGFSDPWEMLLVQPVILFWVAVILLFIFQGAKNHYKILTNILFLVMIGFIISYFIQQTNWRYHYFPATAVACLMLAVMVSGLAVNKANTFSNKLFIYAAIVTMLSFPLFHFKETYTLGKIYQHNTNQLIAFLNTNAQHKSVYLLSSSANEFFPAVDYAHVNYDSRFQHLFWIPGAVKQVLKNGKLTPANSAVENHFRTMVNEDLVKIKPDLIFVDVKDIKPFFHNIRFEFLPYLLSNSEFATEWSHYRYLTTIQACAYDTDEAREYKLYLEPSDAMLDLKKIKHAAIILSGTGNVRQARFVENGKLITDQFAPFTRTVFLDTNDLAALKSQPSLGESKITKEISPIIYKATVYYTFKYQVYQRV